MTSYTWKTIVKILKWVRYWLWDKPTSKPVPIKATEVVNDYVCIDYKGQWINLKKSELPLWNRMCRKDKRGMANKFASLEKKGYIQFIETKGKVICIKNNDYEGRTNSK